MISLKEARERNRLGQFVKEREAEQGDQAILDRTVSSMARKGHKPVNR